MKSKEDLIALVIGNRDAFYKTRDWRTKRLKIIDRDHHECQRCIGSWSEEGREPKYKGPTRARYVHHIMSTKEYPFMCMDDDNLISLCFKCHEEVEGRVFTGRNKKPQLNEERW